MTTTRLPGGTFAMTDDLTVTRLGYGKSSPAGDDQARRARVITLITLFRSSAGSMIDELVERLKAAGFDDVPASQHPVLENLDPAGTRLTTLSARAGMTHQAMGEGVPADVRPQALIQRRLD